MEKFHFDGYLKNLNANDAKGENRKQKLSRKFAPFALLALSLFQ